MNEKSGVFFAFGLVVVTLFFTGSFMFVFLKNEKEIMRNFISPVDVIKTYDDISMYEVVEDEIAVNLSRELNKSELGERYADEFRARFIQKIFENDFLVSFIMDGVELEKRPVGGDAYRSFFENVFYPKESFEVSGNVLRIRRGPAQKHLYIKGDSRWNFPIDFYYNFSREFLINLSSKEIIPEN